MTFQQAAARQYRRSTIYTVVLVGPAGEREQIGTTARKGGRALWDVMAAPKAMARFNQFPDVATLTGTLKGKVVTLSNGWRVEFGGTIRQESE